MARESNSQKRGDFHFSKHSPVWQGAMSLGFGGPLKWIRYACLQLCGHCWFPLWVSRVLSGRRDWAQHFSCNHSCLPVRPFPLLTGEAGIAYLSLEEVERAAGGFLKCMFLTDYSKCGEFPQTKPWGNPHPELAGWERALCISKSVGDRLSLPSCAPSRLSLD